MEPGTFLEIVHVAQRLKDTTRHCTTSGGRQESVAEHSWRISLMALLLRRQFPEADIDRVVAMCLIHDLGECFTGDIPVFRKTDRHRDREERLLRNWVEALPEEVGGELAALYDEMQAQQTPEARLYKALDKLEAVIQHNESPLSSWEPHEYALNQTYAFDAAAFSPWLTKLREAILEETLEKIRAEGT
ncbi:MAG: HD domain-containing protein [Clostridia bacterium]|nr:HD domain-containing protein [Clostridia bacterium]